MIGGIAFRSSHILFQSGNLQLKSSVLHSGPSPHAPKNKLTPRAEGPFEVIEKINDNAYKVDLPGDYEVSATFNVADFSPFIPDFSPQDLRSKSFQQGKDDGNPSSPDHVHEENIPSRPRTRSQTKRMALMLEEGEAGTNGFTSFKVPGFVHSIS